MDLSKLPKLSNTQGAEPVPNPEQPAPVPVQPLQPPPAAPASFIDVWIDIGIGAFILFWQPRFLQWVFSRLFHTHFDEFMLDDKVVPYPSTPEFWMDLGPTLFGIVLILDGILLFTRRRALIRLAFSLTVLTVVYNLGWAIYSFGTYGFAPISFLAVIIGGIIASTQWRQIQSAGAGQLR